MTPDIDLERRVADWLEEGPLEPAEWAVEDAIRHAASTPRRRRSSLGSRAMTRFLVAAAVAAAVILGVAVARFVPSSSVGGPPGGIAGPLRGRVDRLLDRTRRSQLGRRARGDLDRDVHGPTGLLSEPGRRLVLAGRVVQRRPGHP